MSMFLLVRHPKDLARARRDLSAFLALRKQHNPGWVPEPMLGIWVDALMVREFPSSLTVPQPSLDGEPARVRETFGLAGVWELCWLDDEGASRLALLEALLAASREGSVGDAPGRFIPVFRSDLEEAVVRLAIQAVMRERHGLRVLAPWYQDPDTGEVSPAPRRGPTAPPEETSADGHPDERT